MEPASTRSAASNKAGVTPGTKVLGEIKIVGTAKKGGQDTKMADQQQSTGQDPDGTPFKGRNLIRSPKETEEPTEYPKNL